MVRLHYLDNLRWICILVLFPFHTAFIFCAGWYGYYVTSPYSSAAAHALTVAVEPWIMPLLFCIAGMSSNYALRKRMPREYLRERTGRLLVPFLAGLVLVCPVIAYFALKFHAGYTGGFAGAFVHFFSSITAFPSTNGLIGDFSVDHLWFILFLFLFSIAILALIPAWQRLAGLRFGSVSVNLPVLLLLFVPAWLLNYTGPNVTGYSVLSYFAFFLIGYALLAIDGIQQQLERNRVFLVMVWAGLTIGVMWVGGILLGNSDLFWGSSPLFVLTGWCGVLAFLGTGRRLLDFSNTITAYLAAASYPVYIIHQAVLVAVAYFIVMLSIPPALQYMAIIGISLLLTFAGYEIVRRIPVLRSLFGIARRPSGPV